MVVGLLISYVKPKSTNSLIYPEDHETWRTDLCPLGGARAWITAGKTTDRPSWITEDEEAMHEQIFAQGGYTGPLNWSVPTRSTWLSRALLFDANVDF